MVLVAKDGGQLCRVLAAGYGVHIVKGVLAEDEAVLKNFAYGLGKLAAAIRLLRGHAITPFGEIAVKSEKLKVKRCADTFQMPEIRRQTPEAGGQRSENGCQLVGGNSCVVHRRTL
jgi:hypothetical protein